MDESTDVAATESVTWTGLHVLRRHIHLPVRRASESQGLVHGRIASAATTAASAASATATASATARHRLRRHRRHRHRRPPPPSPPPPPAASTCAAAATATAIPTTGPPPPPAVKPTRLLASIGPGAKIDLVTPAKKRVVGALLPGLYLFVVSDRSGVDNFHLTGPGVNRKTGVAAKGTFRWTVRLKNGKYVVPLGRASQAAARLQRQEAGSALASS